jgi:hypothetical protein
MARPNFAFHFKSKRKKSWHHDIQGNGFKINDTQHNGLAGYECKKESHSNFLMFCLFLNVSAEITFLYRSARR